MKIFFIFSMTYVNILESICIFVEQFFLKNGEL